MAMEMSLGKRSRRTKACTMVETSKAVTVKVEMAENPTERAWVNAFVTSNEYLMVAIEKPVIGNVYAHQASENLLHQ